jgi:hypothetical protein
MDQHYPKRRGASLAVVVPILVIGWSGMRPAGCDELMLKWVSAALALSLIAAFLGASGFPIHRMHPMAGWRMHPNGDRWGAPITPEVNPVLPEKPDNGERLSLEVVARALRRLLFATCICWGWPSPWSVTQRCSVSSVRLEPRIVKRDAMHVICQPQRRERGSAAARDHQLSGKPDIMPATALGRVAC